MMLHTACLTLALALSSCSALRGSVSDSHRALQYDWIAGYEPRTQVVDELAIDLDQREMERLLSREESFDSGKAVYEKGGHSRSIARLKLTNTTVIPEGPIQAGTTVVGKNLRGEIIRGKLVETVHPWENEGDYVILAVQYEASEDDAKPLDCQIGGLVVQAAGQHEGCFEGSGHISILSSVTDSNLPTYHYDYEYNMFFDNINGLTLKKMSQDAQDDMWFCDENCPYDEFSKFYRYYKRYDYADAWIQAAFRGIETDYPKVDFSKFDRLARAEAVKVASKTMNVWMYVIRTMEKAVYQCKAEVGCGGRENPCTYEAAHTWDEAVAFYVGSLAGDSGAGEGYLLFDLADTMCAQFRTCGLDNSMHTGTSYVNNMIIKEFQTGVHKVWGHENCTEAEEIKKRIVKLMTIPLIQSTLSMAYNLEFDPDPTEIAAAINEVHGATIAASVLPIIHDCNAGHAETIYNNMKIKDDSDKAVSYREVQMAFDQTYECLDITCDEVGGYWSHSDNDYAAGAAPCGRGYKSRGSNPGAAMLWIVVSAVSLVFLVTMLFVYRRCRNQRDERFAADPANVLPEINVGASFD